MFLLNLFTANHLISYHILPLEQDSESCNDKSRDTDEDHVDEEENGVLYDSDEGLILKAIEDNVCPPFDEEV